jgi:hypothetical protein
LAAASLGVSSLLPTPVGSDAWLRLLGGAGIEDDDEALA